MIDLLPPKIDGATDTEKVAQLTDYVNTLFSTLSDKFENIDITDLNYTFAEQHRQHGITGSALSSVSAPLSYGNSTSGHVGSGSSRYGGGGSGGSGGSGGLGGGFGGSNITVIENKDQNNKCKCPFEDFDLQAELGFLGFNISGDGKTTYLNTYYGHDADGNPKDPEHPDNYNNNREGGCAHLFKNDTNGITTFYLIVESVVEDYTISIAHRQFKNVPNSQWYILPSSIKSEFRHSDEDGKLRTDYIVGSPTALQEVYDAGLDIIFKMRVADEYGELAIVDNQPVIMEGEGLIIDISINEERMDKFKEEHGVNEWAKAITAFDVLFTLVALGYGDYMENTTA